MQESRPSGRVSDERGKSIMPGILERLLVLRATLLLLAIAWLLAVLLAAADEFGWIPHASSMIALLFSIVVPAAAAMAVLSIRRQRAAQQEEEVDPGLDPLTGLPLRRYFIRRLGDDMRRAQRLGRLLTLVVFDVNNMDAVNREYGREVGDEVLRLVARSIQKSKRYTDLAARLGDDEFAVLLPECDERGAEQFVARLEERLTRDPATVVTRRRPVTVWAGVCAGIAQLRRDMADQEEFMAAALAALAGAREERDRRRRAWSA